MEHRASLILSRLPEVGAGRLTQLRQRLGSSRAVLTTPAAQQNGILPDEAVAELAAIQARPDHPLIQAAERDLAWVAENDIILLSPEQSGYPVLLREITAPPPLLYVQGDPDSLSLPQLGIVGSRNPSPTGKTNAFDFARELCRTGFAITSGMALGVDGAAHAGALAAGGKTIAVLGTGIDVLYPRRHRSLVEQVLAQGGTLVSEFPLGTGPQQLNFPRRNRIISGLSLGVLVVEAALKSGSLITARYATQQGREVFAIPGSIHNPLSRGCHALIRDGAILVEQVDDLREPLQGLLALKWNELPSTNPKPAIELSEEERLVFDSLGYEPTTLDQLLERSGRPAGELLSILIGLELKGMLEQAPGGYQRTAAKPQRA
ncbi:DNA-protecting protein DprA [Proteobacteria bacterium 005FR1]|nr:DNA-protecting protein DprA [Proteobacteria bacterium 005FR1]